MEYPMEANGKKGKGKVESISIRPLDDGSFSYCAYMDNGKKHEYSADDMEDIMEMMKEDFKKMGKMGMSGEMDKEMSRKHK